MSKIETLEAGLQPLQGFGQVVQAVASEGEEMEGGERGQTGRQVDNLVVTEIDAVQRGEVGERGWEAGQMVPGGFVR